MNIKIFGNIAEFTGNKDISIPNPQTIALMNDYLNKKYPGLSKYRYVIAVNREIVHGNVPLMETDEVALLPPFSGG